MSCSGYLETNVTILTTRALPRTNPLPWCPHVSPIILAVYFRHAHDWCSLGTRNCKWGQSVVRFLPQAPAHELVPEKSLPHPNALSKSWPQSDLRREEDSVEKLATFKGSGVLLKSIWSLCLHFIKHQI